MSKMTVVTVSLVALVASGLATVSHAQAPFGGDDSVKYAAELWAALNGSGMAGPNAIVANPYKGQHPHGAVLDTIESNIVVRGHAGAAIVKRNYGGEGVSVEAVGNDPRAWLKAVTVMFQRENGYDNDNNNWFWAKYLPDGSLDKNPAGMQLAGRIAKGKPAGCIACHTAAPGGDLVFANDRHK